MCELSPRTFGKFPGELKRKGLKKRRPFWPQCRRQLSYLLVEMSREFQCLTTQRPTVSSDRWRKPCRQQSSSAKQAEPVFDWTLDNNCYKWIKVYPSVYHKCITVFTTVHPKMGLRKKLRFTSQSQAGEITIWVWLSSGDTGVVTHANLTKTSDGRKTLPFPL